MPLRLRLRGVIAARAQHVDEGTSLVLLTARYTKNSPIQVGSSVHLRLVSQLFGLLLSEDSNRVFEAEDFEQADVHFAERLFLKLFDVSLQDQVLVLHLPLVVFRCTSVV